MKSGFTTLLLSFLLAGAFNAAAQENQNISNRYGPPTYTGGDVPSPNQRFAAYQRVYRTVQPTLINTVYPNPATSSANVVLGAYAESPVDVYIINMNGDIMQSYTFNGGGNQLGFDVSSLPNGLYSVQVQERGKSMQSIKLLKQE